MFLTDPIPFVNNFTYGPPKEFQPRQWQQEFQDEFIDHIRQTVNSDAIYYLLEAGTGSGKTKASALAASRLLNMRAIERVMFVCPNRAIQKSVAESFKGFDIHLSHWENKSHMNGEDAFFQGGVITYQSLAGRPEIHRRLCRKRTLVIFDEIHHLGDKQAWDVGARSAFEGTGAIVLGMSGTPYRTDGAAIPFTESLPAENGLFKLKANYSYPLGRAIMDGVCREPIFRFYDATVQIPLDGMTVTRTFKDDLPIDLANRRLAGAVRRGNRSRHDLLYDALTECLDNNHRVIIFLGGDSGADLKAVEDAEKHLPTELMRYGIPRDEIVSVTSSSQKALQRLEEFGKSGARILISVNMVSEGVDIPELTAAIFLTSITAKSTTVQRIGRVLRGKGTAPIFMFGDSRYEELAREIKKSIDYEFTLRGIPRPDCEQGNSTRGPRVRREAVGLESRPDGIVHNGNRWSESDLERARIFLRSKGLPMTYEHAAMYLAIDGVK